MYDKLRNADKLAMFIAGSNDMKLEAATDYVANTIAQIEKLDGRTLDKTNLEDDDIFCIIDSARQARLSGDIAWRELQELESLATQCEVAELNLNVLRSERDKAALAALDAGARVKDVTTYGLISRAWLSKLRKAAKK